MPPSNEFAESLEYLKAEIEKLAAENLALTAILQFLFSAMGDSNPAARPLILKALDDSADFIENFSIANGPRSGHAPIALKVIEQMRIGLTGKGQPKDLV